MPVHSFPSEQVLAGGMIAVIVVVTVILVQRMQRPDAPRSETPDSCWHGGIFYYNPQDPALMVEKRVGVGWTFNFAHPVVWLILGLLIAIPAVIAKLR